MYNVFKAYRRYQKLCSWQTKICYYYLQYLAAISLEVVHRQGPDHVKTAMLTSTHNLGVSIKIIFIGISSWFP